MGTESGLPADFEQRSEFGNTEANLRFLKDAGGVNPALRVLEIGSGRGALLSQLLRLGLQIRGVEISAARIAEGREVYGDLPLDHVTGTALPYADSSFDLVLSFDVFEHIPDSDAHLAEVRRVLVEGGRYLLQTPNKWTNSVFETIRWRSLTAWKVDHCALHTYGQIQRRFARHGFSVRFHDVPVVTDFFRRKLRHYLGPAGPVVLAVANPDRLPLRFRTNFYVEAVRLP